MTNASKSIPNQESGSFRKASVKEAIGKLTGDVTIEAEGKSEKNGSEKASSKSNARSGSAYRS